MLIFNIKSIEMWLPFNIAVVYKFFGYGKGTFCDSFRYILVFSSLW